MSVDVRPHMPPPSPPAEQQTDGGQTARQESGFYTAYAEFAKNLRVWFLAYGIGATAIFVTNEGAGKRLLSSGAAEGVVYLFLIGVGLQILVALMYKTAMWYLYMGEFDAKEKNRGGTGLRTESPIATRWSSCATWRPFSVWRGDLSTDWCSSSDVPQRVGERS
jgi:hypothetical protein